jgi:anti-sigma factor RsiW
LSCDPERVTAYVDGALDPAQRGDIEAHLGGCAACREQEGSERALRSRLQALPPVEPRPGFEGRLRRRLRRRSPLRIILPLAAALLLALWVRGASPFVAWELALDHRHCFGKETLPAQVWSGDPDAVATWFESQGTQLPLIPASAAGLDLVGARYCPLLDASRVAHVYYAGRARHLSLYVVPRKLRGESGWSGDTGGQVVTVLRSGGAQVALVGDTRDDVNAFERALSTRVASASLSEQGGAASRPSTALPRQGHDVVSLAAKRRSRY